LSVLLLTAIPAQAGGISVSQSIDKAEVEFEGIVHLEIELTWPGSQSAYLFDRPLSPDFDGLKVRKFSTSVSSTGSGEKEVTTKKFRYTLVPTSSGQGIIHPIEIAYVTWPDSLPGQLVTEAMMVTIAEPKPVVSSGEGHTFSIYVVIGIILVVLVGSVIGMVVIRRRRPQEVVKSPRDKFLDDLALLKTETSNDLKRFQTGLFRHLVTYLSTQYGLELANLSSEQIAKALDGTDIAPAQKEKIVSWLERAEREKFSPVAVAPGESIRLEAEVREFFEKV